MQSERGAGSARLAIPVGAAWLASYLQTTWSIAGLAAWILPSVCGAASIIALLFGARAARLRVVLLLVAIACAFAALTASAAAVRAPPEPVNDRCEVTLSVNAPTIPGRVDIRGAACRDAALAPGPAVLIELDGERQPYGAVLTARCDAWPHDGVQFLRCAAPDAVELPWYSTMGESMRAQFRAATAPLPGDGAALLNGLAIGDTSRVPESLDDAMRGAGLSHLTAVSGANCALVVAAAFGIAAGLGAGRGLRVAAAVAALGGFVVLVTPEASVVRAGLMAVLALGAIAFGFRARALALLSLAVLIALIVDPQLAVSPGFALSALATCGLIVHSTPIARALTRALPTPLSYAIAVPVAAQLWCLPVLVLLDGGVRPLAVLWNLCAAPAAPIVTVIGLASTLAAAAAVPIGSALAWLAWPASSWIAALARLDAALPEVIVPWPASTLGAVCAAAAVVGVLLLGRARGGVAVIVVAVLIAIGSVQVPQLAQRASIGDWQVLQCDVGQGHATLVRDAGQTMMIDVGPDQALLEECLSLAGVTRIDVLVLTHFDHDHAGAGDALVGRAGLVVHGPTDADGAALIARFAAVAQTAQVRRGDAWMLGRLSVRVLWPIESTEPGNGGSVVLQVGEGDRSVVTVLGDIGQEEQARLEQWGVPPSATVVMAHHGSADQAAELYRALSPNVVLVGVGENSYGHPTLEALKLIESLPAHTLRTDALGHIAIRSDGSVWAEHPP